MPTDKIELEHPEWERQQREPASAYARFRIYLDLGPTRTHLKTAMALGVPQNNIHGTVKSIGNMASKYRWTDRIGAYDSYLAKMKSKSDAEAIAEMSKIHAEQARSVVTTLRIPVQILGEKLRSGEENDFKQMTISELYNIIVRSADAFHKVTNVERISRGEPTEINELQTDDNGWMVILPKPKNQNNE